MASLGPETPKSKLKQRLYDRAKEIIMPNQPSPTSVSSLAVDGGGVPRYAAALDVGGVSDEAAAALHGRPRSPAQDLTAVRKDIEALLRDPRHDDGSFGPLFIRFAWHCCGTYDKVSGTGGSDGATMRFDTEARDKENKGLSKARALLAPVKERHPWLSTADLWILAGYVALEVSGGPAIPFATGRRDFTFEEACERHGPTGCPYGDGAYNPAGSRRPAADLGGDEAARARGAPANERERATIAGIRGTFTRLGLDDRETVLLIVLGHQYGRCHPEVRSRGASWVYQGGGASARADRWCVCSSGGATRACPPGAALGRSRSQVSGNEEAWYPFDPAHWNVYSGGLGYLSTYGMAERYAEVPRVEPVEPSRGSLPKASAAPR